MMPIKITLAAKARPGYFPSIKTRAIELSFVMPAFNEASRISRSIESVARFLARDSRRSEVLIVNDGSSDNTSELVREKIARLKKFQLLELPKNCGKGAAVRMGMLSSRGDRVLMTDTDLSTPLSELSKLDGALDNGFDFAIGSRHLPGSVLQRRQPLQRVMAGLMFGSVVRTLLPIKIMDTQCGFKLFKGEAARGLFKDQTIDGFAFDVEIVTMAIVRGLYVKEVPVIWSDSGESKVSIVGHLPSVVKELLSIRHRWKAGMYSL